MSNRGLSDLIVTIMAAGEVQALPARDHRRLHEALAALDAMHDADVDALWLRFGGRRNWRSDPAVGQRADGVTQAIWDAVNAGRLGVIEDGRNSTFIVTADGRADSRRSLMRLSAAQAATVHRVGAEWALASTSRKKLASSRASSTGTRRVRPA
ncbi:hypothetical protein GCM10009795_026250 [Nocardioides hankookensis]